MEYLPWRVIRVLEKWGHSPPDRPDFTQNYLTAHLETNEHFEDRPPLARAVLSAVPNVRTIDRLADLGAVDEWLRHENCNYEPKGFWIPFRDADRGRRRTSHGILRTEYGGQESWERYLLVARDGYVEYGANFGREYDGRIHFSYVPLAALIHRFVGFTLDFWRFVEDVPQYWMVLSIPNTQGSVIWRFGHGWPDLDRGLMYGAAIPTCLEDRLQLAHPLRREDDAAAVGIWFAKRIADAFGYAEPRCYNREDGETILGSFPNTVNL